MRNRSTGIRTARASKQSEVPGRRRHAPGGGYARGEQTRRRLLEAGIDLFGQLGYERASTRAIARRAGVSLPALQYYFGGKEGLHLACGEYLTADVRARLDPAIARARVALANPALGRADLLQLLRGLLEPFLEATAAERPASWALFFARAEGEQSVAFEAMFQQIAGGMLALVTEIIGRILELPRDAPEVAVRAVFTLGQLALLRRARPIMLRALGWPDFEGPRLQTLKEVIWRGIASGLSS